MSTRPRLFIAGPYRGDNEYEVARNVQDAIQVARPLYRKGYAIYCPHVESYHCASLNEYGDKPLGHNDPEWCDIVIQWLPLCDGLAHFGDIDNSEGTTREIAQARHQGIIARPWQEFPDADSFYTFQREVKRGECEFQGTVSLSTGMRSSLEDVDVNLLQPAAVRTVSEREPDSG